MNETSYSAAAFHPKFEGGRETGALHVSDHGLRFTAGSDTIDLPFEGLSLRIGGASDRLIFFSHPSHPDWSIYTGESAILKNPRIAAAPELTPFLQSIRKTRTTSRAITLAILLGMVLLGYGLVRSKGPLIALVARRIPASLEQKLGDLALRQVTLTSATVTEGDVVRPLISILDRVRTATKNDRYNFRLHVVEDEQVNAFALPGGAIVLNTGLILEAESAEEIAGVMAHEIGHVIEQHSVEQIVSSLGVFAIVQALFGDISGLAAVMIDGGARVLTMSFSRDAEREADEVGLHYLHSADVNPGGMVSFFEKLKRKEPELGAASKALAIISTHPTTDERIRTMRKRIAESQSGRVYRPVAISLDQVKKAIRSSQKKRSESNAGSR